MAELFLLDSNAFITPYRLYYPFDFAQGFWDQLGETLKLDNVSLLDVVVSEVSKNEDELSEWLSGLEGIHQATVRVPSIVRNYGMVLEFVQKSGYYTDGALRDWARGDIADPWLIATAMETGATIVTIEKKAGSLSKKNPSKNAKIPDVAEYFGVKCKDLFYYMRQMGFRLNR